MLPPDWYRLIRPALFALPAETAHALTVRALKAGLLPLPKPVTDPRLAVRLWGRTLPHPVGIAPGFDKHGAVIAEAFRLGAGFLELGGVTPRPQPGNDRPRVFRLPRQGAVINRYGLNSVGLDVFCARLEAYRARPDGTGLIGVNLGKNKDTADPVADYVLGMRRLAGLADFVTVNVSSPNTPGLRALQGRDPLRRILDAAVDVRDRTGTETRVVLKIAPDLTPADEDDIATVALAAGIDGMTIANTSIARPATLGPHWARQAGGLSGRPVFAPSTALLARMASRLDGAMPLIGVGGIDGPDAAWAKLEAGATVVQLYTAMIFEGPGLIPRLLDGLLGRVEAAGGWPQRHSPTAGATGPAGNSLPLRADMAG